MVQPPSSESYLRISKNVNIKPNKFSYEMKPDQYTEENTLSLIRLLEFLRRFHLSSKSLILLKKHSRKAQVVTL